MTGTIYGVIGSLMLSLYSIYTKKILPSVNQEIWLLSYYNNAYSIFIFMPLILINGEVTVLMNYSNFDTTYFWIQMLIGGLCGFAIGYFTSLQIKVSYTPGDGQQHPFKYITPTRLNTQLVNRLVQVSVSLGTRV